MNKLFWTLGSLLISINLLQAQSTPKISPLPNAHAHNDYEHGRPLLDALEQGFTSIEVDVFAIDGELFVAHNRPHQPDTNRTLKKLYLQPLAERISENGGQVYPGYDVLFYLMIDFKTAADPTYAILNDQLQAYEPILTTYRGNLIKPGPVTIFISGNRPIQEVLSAKQCLVALDGRPENLGKGIPSSKMPVISDRYGKYFDWRGEGPMPTEEWRKLRTLVANTHAEGKRIRLWATPENQQVWTTLLEAGVDLLNTDQLKELRAFLTAY